MNIACDGDPMADKNRLSKLSASSFYFENRPEYQKGLSWFEEDDLPLALRCL